MAWEFPTNGGFPIRHNHKLRRGRNSKIEDLVYIGRRDWNALPNLDEEPLELPVEHVRTDDTKTEQCQTKEECIKWIQETQVEHMRKGMPDIQWNFMIGGDGNVYEGRGWKLDATRCYETYSGIQEDCIDIAFIGTYPMDTDVPEFMFKKVEEIIGHGVKHKFINCCHRVIPYIYGRVKHG